LPTKALQQCHPPALYLSSSLSLQESKTFSSKERGYWTISSSKITFQQITSKLIFVAKCLYWINFKSPENLKDIDGY
jgi:hypothetical protein